MVSTVTDAPAPAGSAEAPRKLGDYTTAVQLQSALRTLARRAPSYAGLLAERPGIRLAVFVRTGAVGALTDQGRALLQSDLGLVTRAAMIPPGLDTNSFYDRLLGRPVPVRTPPARPEAA